MVEMETIGIKEKNMTCCIGAVDKESGCCYIGADSCISYDSFYIKTITSKVIRDKNHNDILWGCAGSIRMANLILQDDRMFPINLDTSIVNLEYLISYTVPILKEYCDLLSQNNKEFDLILAIRESLYRIQNDLAIYEVKDFVTIGCGCCSAYGAMKAYKSLESYPIEKAIFKSINISSGYDYGVSCPVVILKTDNIEK